MIYINRILGSYQECRNMRLQYRPLNGIVNPMLMTVPLQTVNTYGTSYTTRTFNSECKNYLDILREKRNQLKNKLTRKLSDNPNYRGDRQKGVQLAWEYEQADVNMGGRGSSEWNDSQCQEIKERGSVRDAEGHHQKNVADHPEEQSNPDNIKFYKSREEHRQKGHQGNWQNESDAPMIDKDKMLKITNLKRVIKNELKGAGIAAVIGFATGASIGFMVTLVQNGLSPESFKEAAIVGGKLGVEGMGLGIFNHLISRTIGELATGAMTGLFSNMGVRLTDNVLQASNMGIIGSIIILTSSIYQFVRLKREGCNTEECLSRMGKQVLVSTGTLAVTVVVQATYGGPAAMAVAIGIAAITLGYSMYQVYHNKDLVERIQYYIIEKSYPF